MSQSKAFGTQTPRRPHLVFDGKGGLPGEIADLRKDSETAFYAVESQTNYPLLDWVDGDVPANGASDLTLYGTGLLQGQSFASVTLGASLEIIACVPGVDGNDLSVEVTDDLGGGLDVTYAAGVLNIDLGGATPDEDTIATAINNAVPASYQIIRANSGGGAAFGLVAETSLTGGLGEGWNCYISGVDSLLKHDVGAATSVANLTETLATVDVPDLTAETIARAAGDDVNIRVQSDGVTSHPITSPLT